MSTNKSRRPPRGNTQRRSNVSGLPPYAETLRPGPTEPVPPVASTTPPPVLPVLVNGSALPKAAAVVVHAAANDADEDSPPDSSTRIHPAAAHVPEVAEKTDPPVKAKAVPKVDVPVVPVSEERAVKPTRAERRSRERGKGRGRSSASTPEAPPVESVAVDASQPADAVSAPAPASRAGAGESGGHASPAGRAGESGGHASAAVDLDERFFAEGIQSEREGLPKSHSSPAVETEEEIDPKILLKMHPDVRARRAKYASLVKWVVLAVILVGLGGLVKHRMSQGDQDTAAREMEEYKATHPPGARTDTPPSEPAPAQAAAAPTEAPAPAAAPAESAPAPGESPQANTDKGAVPPAAAPLTSPQASALGAAAATPPPTPPTPPAEESAPAKTAAQEKRDCQVFLDRGANGKAIAAGERSVALDPSDGEAWLLLGGAYQVTGRAGDAKRAFNSCVKQGKRGPIADCKSMLQ